MYVSCYLAAKNDLSNADKKNNYSAGTCIMATGMLMFDMPERGKLYCPPNDAAMRDHAVDTLAGVYLDFYETLPGDLADANGVKVFVAALTSKWPCKP